MKNTVWNFLSDEDGAITVDWVVLTALVVGLAVAAYAGIDGGVADLALNIQSYLLNITVGG